MKRKQEPTVKFVLDADRPPPLTEEQKKELEALAALREDQIDYSDLPPMAEEVLDQMFRPRKKQLTLRIDMDVIAWQKSKGKGYQVRINRILRQAMLKELKSHR